MEIVHVDEVDEQLELETGMEILVSGELLLFLGSIKFSKNGAQ